MTIRLTTDRVDKGHAQFEGQVIDLTDDEARRLIRAGQAEACERPGKTDGKPKRK